ncbi:MAG: DinB family protein [Coriobacteriia bacterium]|nr:DinB family protein [Coriobacteriia bacterium]
MQISMDSMRSTIKSQFELSWSLLEYHLDALDDDECFWKPSPKGLYVEMKHGAWSVDWPESEGYEIGPPNIAWLTWHIMFWWSMVFDHSFGNGTLKREDVLWLGTINDVREAIYQFHRDWLDKLGSLSDEEFASTERTKWPLEQKPFYELAAWLNVELMKNAAEIGYCRFLYANRT